jgi:hypothetical protein
VRPCDCVLAADRAARAVPSLCAPPALQPRRATAHARLPRGYCWRSAARVSDSRTRARAGNGLRARACCACLQHSRWAWRMRPQRGADCGSAVMQRCNGPSSGADVAGVGPVPAQMWQGRAQSRCRCGRGWAQSRCGCGRREPSPGARCLQQVVCCLLSLVRRALSAAAWQGRRRGSA